MTTALEEMRLACRESDEAISRRQQAILELHPIPSPRPPLHWAIALACFGIGAIVGAAVTMAAMVWGVGG
jgi:hypothetical protein